MPLSCKIAAYAQGFALYKAGSDAYNWNLRLGKIAEIFRGGIQSISQGQFRAGLSLGMTYGQTMRYIVLPQAFKRIIPPLGNEFIAMLKDSSSFR